MAHCIIRDERGDPTSFVDVILAELEQYLSSGLLGCLLLEYLVCVLVGQEISWTVMATRKKDERARVSRTLLRTSRSAGSLPSQLL